MAVIPYQGRIGKLPDPAEFAGKRTVVEGVAFGEAAASRAHAVDRLADDDLGSAAAVLVRAPVRAGPLLPLVPEVKAAAHGLDSEPAGVAGTLVVGDKPELEAGLFPR